MDQVVVKLGSSVVADADGAVRSDVLESVCSDIAALRAEGREVVVVSSGAIARGVDALGLPGRPRAIDELQAASAVGQVAMFRAWEEGLASRGLIAAQVLMMLHDIADRDGNLSIAATLKRLLAWGTVPVINENDTTTTDEITFGDNDLLAAQVAIMLGAGRLVLLTDADGLHESDPRTNPEAPLIREVSDMSQIEGFEVSQRPGEYGSGGMRSKVVAAEMATSAGVETIVAPGGSAGSLLTAAHGGDVGTRFLASRERHGSFKSWLRYAKPAKGTLVVDAGAAKALVEKGTSLLPVGIVAVEGEFQAGDSVEVAHEGRVIGKGLVSCSSEEIDRVKGMNSSEIRDVMPRAADEAVHRDRFVLS
ncbi:MAG: glutamate 5-kinase [Actinomycetes bacterium]